MSSTDLRAPSPPWKHSRTPRQRAGVCLCRPWTRLAGKKGEMSVADDDSAMTYGMRPVCLLEATTEPGTCHWDARRIRKPIRVCSLTHGLHDICVASAYHPHLLSIGPLPPFPSQRHPAEPAPPSRSGRLGVWTRSSPGRPCRYTLPTASTAVFQHRHGQTIQARQGEGAG